MNRPKLKNNYSKEYRYFFAFHEDNQDLFYHTPNEFFEEFDISPINLFTPINTTWEKIRKEYNNA